MDKLVEGFGFITDSNILNMIKERLHDDILDPMLKLEERIELYSVIRNIDHWIEEQGR